MQRHVLRFGLAAIISVWLLTTSVYAQIATDTGAWQGGTGNFSNQGQWSCSGLDFPQGATPCVPNGPQFSLDMSNGGSLNIDTNVVVDSMSGGQNLSLSLNGTSLTIASGADLASATLTNGATMTVAVQLNTVNLMVQNSTVNANLGVGPVAGGGTANISGGTIQQLAVFGTFTISNTTLGDNSELINMGPSSISGTSFNGDLDLSRSGSVVVDKGSKINSVLLGTPLPVIVGGFAGSSATLTIQGSSQLSINGEDLELGLLQGSAGTVVLNDTSTLSANNETIGDGGTGNFTQNGGKNTASAQVTLGAQAGSNGTYALRGGQLTAGTDLLVGVNGSGGFTQSSGATNTVTGQLILGDQATGVGTYQLSGQSVLGAATEIIGNQAGMGTFTQGGGTNTISGTLTLGMFLGPKNDRYDLNGGQLTAGDEIVGAEGQGTFNQNGGTNTITSSLSGTGTLTLGSVFRGVGTYNLGGGQLTAGEEIVGADGAGELVQFGGSNTVTGTLTLASSISGSGTGTYFLSSGPLSAANEVIGKFGTGRFTQSGGTNQVSGTLTLGQKIGVEGDYNLGGTVGGTGELSAGNEVIGDLGQGAFVQAFGTQTFNSALGTITLGAQSGSNGSYTLIGAGNDVFATNEVIGDSGVGFFRENSGADNKITGTLTLGNSGGGTGEYDLVGGTLEAGTEVIGGNGRSATFNQTGGTNTVSGNLGVAASASALGTYNLSGGVLNASSETLGNDPCVILTCPVSGTFNENGGTNTTNNLAINFGSYNLSGGSLQASITNNGTFNYSGGILKGNFTNDTGAMFNISGAGTVVVNGALTNMGTVTVTAQQAQFSNVTLTSGVFKADPTAVEFQNLTVGAAGVIIGAAGDVFSITGNFQNLSTQNTQWDTSSSVLDFTGGGSHIFDLAGQNGAGFSNNFAWGSLVIDPGNILDLALGSGDALYAFILQGLIISGNTITNIDGTPGLFLYYDAADNPSLNGNYNLTGGGELIAANGPAPTPEPGTLLLMATGLSSLLARRRRREKERSPSSR